ncbi:NADH-ubiquinone oxidoreductase-F iron-sulfur binding region domain-containing protein [Parasphingorhabdus cellanae]|uniref:Formate dehydrogenase n=1 Tax=Parasphingorhabdus cellanae TaxID=2806553 RepID=A0ABX7T5V2_9SPHN|nr:NADH-ubiquinone oxidoreductase-F iron-sulfur binding region domain-containing protein [Parasphingorhabdus cellanae]QTD55844.1 formate dehydrogenase [Parasphingorhabdus cellanae]
MTRKISISDDALAIACGANKVAEAFRKLVPDAEIIRTSSWGMHWLEPLVEIDGQGFGPVSIRDVEAVISGTSDLSIGHIEEHPFLTKQNRLTFARAGKTQPLSLDDYEAMDGWMGYRAARKLGSDIIIEMILESGLRGRGGAGFPAGIKWRTVADTPGAQKYIVCNADEGDSGTFADRMLMEGDPYCLIEGMAIAGLAVGADKGFIYVRSEYPHAIAKLRTAIAHCANIVAPFDIEVRVGAGVYVCGEETSLLESLEGKRGEVRAKPPLPAIKGLFGRPTVVNNVLTLAAVPYILAHGARAYADYGMGRSRGTMPIQLAGNIKHGGLFETAFGISLGELVNDIGGGTASGKPIKAVQAGGPLGAYHPPAQFDLPFDYESFTKAGGLIGHGGIVVFDDSADMMAQARFAMEFCAAESCGKCTPCRLGSIRGLEIFDRMAKDADLKAKHRTDPVAALPQMHNAPKDRARTISSDLQLIRDLCDTMEYGSLCALGGFTPYPVMSAIKNWPEDFGG